MKHHPTTRWGKFRLSQLNQFCSQNPALCGSLARLGRKNLFGLLVIKTSQCKTDIAVRLWWRF